MGKRKFADAELIDLYINKDLSSIKIAQIFKVRVSSVCRRLNRLGIIKPACGANGRNGKKSKVYLKGYPVIYMPSLPRAKGNGYVKEHILVAEKCLGRSLTDGEVVHHINENKTDNSPENLVVFQSHGEHMKHHWQIRKYGNGIALPNALYVMEGIAEVLRRRKERGR